MKRTYISATNTNKTQMDCRNRLFINFFDHFILKAPIIITTKHTVSFYLICLWSVQTDNCFTFFIFPFFLYKSNASSFSHIFIFFFLQSPLHSSTNFLSTIQLKSTNKKKERKLNGKIYKQSLLHKYFV